MIMRGLSIRAVREHMGAGSAVLGHSAAWHFYRSYVGTALWSTNHQSDERGDAPLDDNRGEADLAPETRRRMQCDCAAFYAANFEHIHCHDVPDYEAAAIAAGWTRKKFGEAWKWWSPSNDDGSRYQVGRPRSLRNLCEDHGIEPATFRSAPLDPGFDGPIAAREASMAGHDFWLTRCGHGAGFLDGDWPEPHASALDEAAKAFGNVDLYVGDDGRIWA